MGRQIPSKMFSAKPGEIYSLKIHSCREQGASQAEAATVSVSGSCSGPEKPWVVVFFSKTIGFSLS